MKVIGYFTIILFTPILLLVNFRLLVFNHNFYKMEFKKLGVYENFSSPEIVNFESKQLINYYCCHGTLSSTFYTQRELLHLVDVKNLIEIVNIYLYVLTLALIACMVLIVRKGKRKMWVISLNLAALITIVSIFTFWLLSTLNFNSLFINFHRSAFNNNNWLLPKEANLIKLFPPQFFADFANQIALQTLTMAALVLIITNILKRKDATKQY